MGVNEREKIYAQMGEALLERSILLSSFLYSMNTKQIKKMFYVEK